MAGAAGKARVMQIGCFQPEMHLPGDQRMCACGKGGALGLWTQGLSGSSAQPALMSPACSPTSGLSCRSVLLAERSLSTFLTPCTARLAGDSPRWVSPVTPPQMASAQRPLTQRPGWVTWCCCPHPRWPTNRLGNLNGEQRQGGAPSALMPCISMIFF